MAEGSWDSILQQWLVDTKKCEAASLSQRADYVMYAAAPVEGEAGWTYCYKEDREEMIMQEDGTEKPISINEAATLKESIENDLREVGPPKNGLWIGGEKYKVVQRDAAYESGDNKFIWVLAAGPNKKGVHIVATEQSVLMGMYQESKGQTSGNCKNAVVEMADYLISVGQ